MIASKPTPSGSWSFVVTALAEMGRTEIERRQRAAEIHASAPEATDQADDGRDSANTVIAATEAAE
jgi:hypothetical protein